jgi:hypothetical protein
LVEDREKNSEKLGRLALFKGSSQVVQLPPYLTVQLVRFFYKAEARQKAKILRKVGRGSCRVWIMQHYGFSGSALLQLLVTWTVHKSRMGWSQVVMK